MSHDGAPTAADQGWTLLRTGAREHLALGVPSLPSGVTSPAGEILFAISPQGEARLLLPLTARDRIPENKGAPALTLSEVVYSRRGMDVPFLELTCLSKELETVFSEVADEILRRVGAGAECVPATLSTLRDFRQLLVHGPVAAVAASVVVGVLGELYVLNRLLDRSPGAWRAWRGPAGDRHDFRAGGASLEVKATGRPGNTVISMTSIDQLTVPTNGTLHLLHVVLERVGGGPMSVSALGRAAMGKADEPERVREHLAALGCEDPGSPAWNELECRLQEETLYEVVDTFPKIVPSMLAGGAVPAGVVSLKYDIDLAVAGSCRRTTADRETLEEELVRCLSNA